MKSSHFAQFVLGWNFYSDVLLLMRMLKRSEIEGIVLDKYTLVYTKDYLRWKQNNIDYMVNSKGVYREKSTTFLSFSFSIFNLSEKFCLRYTLWI